VRMPAGFYQHYEKFDEGQRLFVGIGPLERVRVQQIMTAAFPPPPGRVVDIGGGTGVHASWLVDRGYEVDLVDLVPRHVDIAKDICPAFVGDARSLPFGDGVYDAALMGGPLYHLPERSDRLRALGEAWRVLKPGGVLVGVALSPYQRLVDLFITRRVNNPGDRRHALLMAKTGQLTYDGRRLGTGFAHHPQILRAEVEEAGFEAIVVKAVESLIWMGVGRTALWPDPGYEKKALEMAAWLDTAPSILGMSPHLAVIAQRGPGA
jgi:SAM-dependent methyltransferase